VTFELGFQDNGVKDDSTVLDQIHRLWSSSFGARCLPLPKKTWAHRFWRVRVSANTSAVSSPEGEFVLPTRGIAGVDDKHFSNVDSSKAGDSVLASSSSCGSRAP